jgi:hypothetical protein
MSSSEKLAVPGGLDTLERPPFNNPPNQLLFQSSTLSIKYLDGIIHIQGFLTPRGVTSLKDDADLTVL